MKALTPTQHLIRLRRSPIYVGEGTVRNSVLTWRYDRKPTIFSRWYKMRLNYRRGDSPKIYVDDPDLRLLADGRDLPHVYEQRPARLCLYLPTSREWTPLSFFDETILPWADLWLHYYEDWLFSDEWKGGGVHPESEGIQNRADRRRQQVERRQLGR